MNSQTTNLSILKTTKGPLFFYLTTLEGNVSDELDLCHSMDLTPEGKTGATTSYSLLLCSRAVLLAEGEKNVAQ